MPAAATQVDLPPHVTFVEKMPTVPENSTEQLGREFGDYLHKDFIECFCFFLALSNIRARKQKIQSNQLAAI